MQVSNSFLPFGASSIFATKTKTNFNDCFVKYYSLRVMLVFSLPRFGYYLLDTFVYYGCFLNNIS